VKTMAVQASAVSRHLSRPTVADQTSTLSLLVWEGAYANVFIVLTGGAFLTVMAILLGVNDFELGLLAAAPFLMQSVQLLLSYLFRNPAASKDQVALTLAVSRIVRLAVLPLLLLSGAWRLQVLIGIMVVSGLLTMVSWSGLRTGDGFVLPATVPGPRTSG